MIGLAPSAVSTGEGVTGAATHLSDKRQKRPAEYREWSQHSDSVYFVLLTQNYPKENLQIDNWILCTDRFTESQESDY